MAAQIGQLFHCREAITCPATFSGVDFSDHRSFWEVGYPAVMIIDTAFYRNPNYHTETDTIDTLNFDKMSDLLKGLVTVAKNLAMTSSSR